MKSHSYDLRRVDETFLAMRQKLGAWFCCLPAAIQALVFYDSVFGAELVAQGRERTIREAKHPGRPFLEVFLSMEGHPTTLVLGGARGKAAPKVVEFNKLHRACDALLGISGTNGGGPGVMGLDSMHLRHAINKVRESSFLAPSYEVNGSGKIAAKSDVVQVRLGIPGEKPNEWGSADLITWSQGSLMSRTAMLMALGNVLAVYAYPGGYGTSEEIFRILVDRVLENTGVNTIVTRGAKIVLVSSMDDTGTSYYQPFMSQLARMAKEGMIGANYPDFIEEVCVEEVGALDRIMSIQDQAAQRIYGFSFVEEWERLNSAKLIPTARELVR
ncbi:MAG: LOG family protein [Deltaproteobacteria bacterium]|nr:LOG family protein [Deltaproteobacteria bacterium]